MPIRFHFSRGLEDEPYTGYVDGHQPGFWPDPYTGQIILTRYINNRKGGEVYIARGNFMDDTMSSEMGDALRASAHFYMQLLPWMNIDLPTRLPDGEKVILNLLAEPRVIVQTIGGHLIASEIIKDE